MSVLPANSVRQFTIAEDDDGVRLDRWFKRNLPQVGFATISRWARTGQIRVDGKRAKPEDRLTAGQVLRVPPGGEDAGRDAAKPRARALSPEQIAEARAMVIRETPAAIVLNKPPGLATQGGSKTTKHVDGLLDAFVEDERTPRPRLVHRLDKDTSGVLVVAKTAQSAKRLARLFQTRDVKKTYWAICLGLPAPRAVMVSGSYRSAGCPKSAKERNTAISSDGSQSNPSRRSSTSSRCRRTTGRLS